MTEDSENNAPKIRFDGKEFNSWQEAQKGYSEWLDEHPSQGGIERQCNQIALDLAQKLFTFKEYLSNRDVRNFLLKIFRETTEFVYDSRRKSNPDAPIYVARTGSTIANPTNVINLKRTKECEESTSLDSGDSGCGHLDYPKPYSKLPVRPPAEDTLINPDL